MSKPTEYDAVLGNGILPETELIKYRNQLMESNEYNLAVSLEVVRLLELKIETFTKSAIKKEGGIKKLKERMAYWKGKADSYKEILKIL